MPKEKLEPSQWIVDVVALSDAAGEFLSNAGGAITTAIAVVSVASIVGICVLNGKDLPSWAQVILGTSGVAGVVYDPRKSGQTIKQEFQQPVDNVASGAQTITETATATPSVTPSVYTLPKIDDLSDEGEWLTPQEAATR